jgi:hypothetical protein
MRSINGSRRAQPELNPHNAKKRFRPQHIFVQSFYDKALLGHQRADVMQKPMEAMQTLVAQLTVRMQTGMERRKKMSTKTTGTPPTETLDRFETFLDPS